jgi:uncharacterized cofD-like protein
VAEQRVVVVGGGTGSYTVLMGLKRYTKRLTAVVTMADDGGSSGRLRDELGQLPQGDIRRCLVALSANRHLNQVLRKLFEYRFEKGEGLQGHSFGNLLLAALTEVTGSLEQAIFYASKLLNVRGCVLPVTTDDVRLAAELEDDTIIWGEKNIDVRVVKPNVRIRYVFLRPSARVYPPAAEAIRNADILVIGPGDLYTSIVPNLLVQGVPEAIQACQGVRVYICNLMTKRGETDGFAASDFVSTLFGYLRSPRSLDCMVVNTGGFPQAVLDRYAKEGAFPVVADVARCQRLVPKVFALDLVAKGNLARHDSQKLARHIVEIESLPGIRNESHATDLPFRVLHRNGHSPSALSVLSEEAVNES